MEQIAILYQFSPAPSKDGVIKPMKPNGYSDSGADLAIALIQNKLHVLTPVKHPDPAKDLDWVFPDTHDGIQNALDQKAKVFWLNTVLFNEHPINNYHGQGIKVVGQASDTADKYDNKWTTNELLRNNKIPVPAARLIARYGKENDDFHFPVVLKPIRGRGSQGVVVVHNPKQMTNELKAMFQSEQFGDKVYAETYLTGKEITVTVMPPGTYMMNKEKIMKQQHWCLPPVLRFNHINGIAPYSGHVAVVKNSRVLKPTETDDARVTSVLSQCEKAASLINAKAPIRIDCREGSKDEFFLFDLNLKPNMTGPSRAHRKDQDSLTVIAAQAIGWSYADLVLNILNQKWSL